MSTELQPTGPADTSSVELTSSEPNPRELDHQREEAPEPTPLDRRAAIEKAQADVAAKEAEKPKEEPKLPEKAEAEPKVEAKPEAKVQEQKTQPEKSDSVERAAQEGERPKSSEGKVSEAPARFLPKAQELWHQAPKVVRQEVERAFSEYEEERKQYQAVTQEWESLKAYDQAAKTNGTTIKEALDRYTSIDKMLHSNPVQGLTEVFKIAGVDPRQFAQQILGQNPQQPNGQQQPQRDPQVVNVVTQQQQAIQQLNQKLSQMEEAQRIAEVKNTLIEPFKADHPRFDELEPKMATILNSGLVPQNLDHWQRLEAAYDMAERITPRSMASSSELLSGPTPESRQSAASGKSIKGAPTPGTELGNKAGQKLDRKAAIKAAMAELGH